MVYLLEHFAFSGIIWANKNCNRRNVMFGGSLFGSGTKFQLDRANHMPTDKSLEERYFQADASQLYIAMTRRRSRVAPPNPSDKSLGYYQTSFQDVAAE